MIIGIDLGTTNSLAAYFTPEGPKLIPNRLGKFLTPSVVSIDNEGGVYVGETACERELLYPESAASFFKRDMGSDKIYTLNGKPYRAEELASFILRSLKEDAEDFLQEEVTEAVISVPAYFNDERRRATKRAGALAGLTVERIISEPTAAALSYGLYDKHEDATFLVFDLGGGTFDVSVLELFDNILEVRAVAGDNYLGGEDFTRVLMQMFCEEHQLDMEKLDIKTCELLRKQANDAKHCFTQQDKAVISFVHDGEQLTSEIALKAYEGACEALLERIRQPVKRSLTDTGVKMSDIDKVVLIGGATKMPVIRRFVSRLFKQLPDCTVNPDEAVALGAAIQAAMKNREAAIKEVILTDVCPFTLGTEVSREVEEGRMEAGFYCPIIERNTVIPASRTSRLYTAHDQQSKICLRVLQGESRFAKNNLLLGEVETEVPKAAAGDEAIDVTYTYDVNSILEVEIKVISTGAVSKMVIKNQKTTLTDAEIKKRFEELSYLKIHPRDQEENKLLLLRGERMYESAVGDKRTMIERALEQFEHVLASYDKVRIQTARAELKQFFEEIDEID